MAVRLVRRLVLAAEGRTDGLRAQVRQVADAGPLDRLEQRLDPEDEPADAERGRRPLHQVGAAHAQRGPSPPAAPADQGVLGDHGEVGPGDQHQDHGERQELRVLRPRHGLYATGRGRSGAWRAGCCMWTSTSSSRRSRSFGIPNCAAGPWWWAVTATRPSVAW